MNSFQQGKYVVYYEINWANHFVKVWVTDMVSCWYQELVGLEILKQQVINQIPQFSSSNLETLYTGVLSSLIKNPTSIDIGMTDWILTKPTCSDQVAPGKDTPALVIDIYGNADIVSLHWKFECFQMIPHAAAEFIKKNVIIPMAAVNDIMRSREDEVLRLLNLYKNQVDLIEQLYKVELKREAVKMVDVEFDQDKFKAWKGIDWRKHANAQYPQDMLEKMLVYRSEMRKIEILDAEVESQRAAARVKLESDAASGSTTRTAPATSNSQSTIESQELRQLKREADLEKAKAKSKKKKMF